MAKRKRQPMPGGGKSSGANFGGGMAKRLQELQQEMVDTQAALGDETIEVTAGGGVITVEMTGHQKLTKITLAPEVVDPEEIELLQDLIIAAINEAVEKSQAMASERLEGLTGGLSIPGLF
jgi:DNA-binding YbaB/EbfC family protein